MIILTGGAGFIGSYLHSDLVARGFETVIVDWLGTSGKWRNVAKHRPTRLIWPDALDDFLADEPAVEAIVHLGAISETTAVDGDLVWETNVVLSMKLWDWCVARGVRFIYASSAATYGTGEIGFDDDPSLLPLLRPLNLYAWSKHVFDMQVFDRLARGNPAPPQWAGLKIFNVYGPNEYHKGNMISVVKVKYDEVMAGKPISLFKSDRSGLADGEHSRDFVWVGDVADVITWLLDNPEVSGLFNLGTGTARTYLDLAYAVCDALGRTRHVEFIDMPDTLRGQYQYYTQANMSRIRAAGYDGRFTTMEDGVRRYVQDYLLHGPAYR
jgi:ADP-L-glycero-D-manno-heptose 6-epimerase